MPFEILVLINFQELSGSLRNCLIKAMIDGGPNLTQLKVAFT